MRAVLALGGSVLAPELNADRVAAHAEAIGSLADEGCDLAVVVGGGSMAREYIDTARELGANEVVLDQLGIGTTRLNARLLVAALGGRAVSAPVTDYDEASDALRHGDVVVMGGVTPGQTTDAVAAALAEHVDADLLVYGTSTDGVFDMDPSTTDGATRYDRLTPSELVDVIAPMSRDAGASAPVDLLAAKLIERSGIRTIVLDATDPGTLTEAVLEGEHTGTDIVPETSTEPTAWARR